LAAARFLGDDRLVRWGVPGCSCVDGDAGGNRLWDIDGYPARTSTIDSLKFGNQLLRRKLLTN